jgi:hypothetical protein
MDPELAVGTAMPEGLKGDMVEDLSTTIPEDYSAVVAAVPATRTMVMAVPVAEVVG